MWNRVALRKTSRDFRGFRHFPAIVRTRFRALPLLVVCTLLTFHNVSLLSQSSPSDFDSLVSAAAAARSQGDTAQAMQLYTQALALNPKWPDGWWFLGTMRYGADQYATARDALDHFIDLTPDATAALALRGLCEFETGDYAASLQDLQHGIALGAANQPRNAQILLYHEALALTRLGRFDEAIGKYMFFVKQAPMNPDLLLAVGLAGLRMPLLPKEVDPSQLELVSMVGQAAVAVMTGDMAAGQQDFRAVFSRYPATANVHYLYGYLLFGAHSDDAIPQFQQEIAVSPHSAIAHAMLAWALEFEGDFDKALVDAKEAATEDPSLAMCQLVYARALVETGDVEDGMVHLESVLKMDPGNLEAHLTLAKAYSKLGRTDYAQQERALCLQLADHQAGPNAP